nr:DUF5625 family protein [Xenorhabdus sp. Flor]
MKVLQGHQRFRNWGRIIVFLSFALLAACSKYIDIYIPIDVSKSGQSVKIDFEISKKGNYQFALLFANGNGFDEMERRDKLFGNIDKDGMITPIWLHMVKNDKVFLTRK